MVSFDSERDVVVGNLLRTVAEPDHDPALHVPLAQTKQWLVAFQQRAIHGL
ncbi:MAG TPA: hypothetical protein VGP82_07225 [Ktedonobacterales bacterium]|jgi:hypothetical protein|nr:hypothetical protein [Ktedonobacterales bacterium]